MKRKTMCFLLFSGMLIAGIFFSGKIGIADDLWDEDDTGEPEVFDEEGWETGDSFDTEQYSVELIEGGVRIISCQMENEPETIQTPTEITYDNKSYPVLEIGDEAFAGISGVKKIEIAEGICQIGEYAFGSCEQLEQITLPQSITSIGKGAFSECPALHTIQINKENKHFSITDNCLYQDRKMLVWCSPETEEVEISKDTEIIAEAAFSGCQLLTQLDIPTTVTIIEENAFEECVCLDIIHFQEQSLFQLQKNSLPDIEQCTIYVENEEIQGMVEASQAYEGENISVVVKKEYALRYECNGGSLDRETRTSYSNLEEILLPEPDREDFLFLGWSETPEDKGEYIISYEAGTQGNKTLYAMWEPDTDAEDTSLLNEEEEHLLQQDTAKKDCKQNILKRRLAVTKKKQSNIETEEQALYVKDEEDRLLEAASEEQRETGTADVMEETQTEQDKEQGQTKQKAEKQIETKKEPQERKTSIPIILLFISGLLLTTGSIGGLLYIRTREKKEQEDN